MTRPSRAIAAAVALLAAAPTVSPAAAQIDPGSLGAATVADITAYILTMNQFPTGTSELPRETQALQQIRIVTTKPAPK
jgi:hypothetical protein